MLFHKLLGFANNHTLPSIHMHIMPHLQVFHPTYFRQQERHLGIIKSLDAPPARKKHDVHSFVVNKDSIKPNTQNTDTPFKYLDSSMIAPVESAGTSMNSDAYFNTKILNFSGDFVYPVNVEMLSIDKNSVSVNAEIKATKLNEVESWILAAPTVVIRKREVTDGEELKEDLIDIPLESEGNETQLFKREILRPEQQPPVQVHIQNITEVNI